MSFAIEGMGIACPPDAVTADEGLAFARVLAGPDVRTSAWLASIYANSGVARRFQVIGGEPRRAALTGIGHTGSPFQPTKANEGIGPTTAERMKLYAEEAGRMAVPRCRPWRSRKAIATPDRSRIW